VLWCFDLSSCAFESRGGEGGGNLPYSVAVRGRRWGGTVVDELRCDLLSE